MPASIKGPLIGESTGLADSVWIADVRDKLRDYLFRVNESKAADGSSGVNTSTSMPYRVSRPPINDGSLICTVNAVAQAVIESGAPGANQVLVNYDTGELTFSAAPPATQPIAVQYQPVRWRDQTILNALYAGMRRISLVKSGRQFVDTQIVIQIMKWEYDLPPAFASPRARILGVEVRDPDIPTEDWREVRRYEQVEPTVLRIPNAMDYSPGQARIRVTGWGPYARLADMEPELYEVPLWYALAVLNLNEAARMARTGNSQPRDSEGQKGENDFAAQGKLNMDLFKDALEDLKRAPGPRYKMKIVAPRYER